MKEAKVDDLFGDVIVQETFDRSDLRVGAYLEDALAENLWNLKATQVYEAREMAQTYGDGIKVAIIDTWVNYEHPQLKDSCSDEKEINLSGEGGISDFMDNNGHGTFVAGVVAGREFGIAPGVEIYTVKISNGGVYDPKRLFDALEWCIYNRIDLVNISSGTPKYREDIGDLCKIANKGGLVIVAAAGNNSTGAFFPASYDEYVISVGAIASDYRHCIFSNIWPTTDIVAPGEGIFSAYSDEAGREKYTLSRGTSAAAPHVTGILSLGLSLLKRVWKKIEIESLEKLLRDTALSYLDGERRKPTLSLAEEYSQKYDPKKVYIKRNKGTARAIYGAGLVQARDFIEKLIKTTGVKNERVK